MLLPWHEQTLERIKALAADQALSSTLCLVGQRGWGTHYLLNAAIKALVGLTDEREVAEIAHPDMIWVEPDGAEIKIGQARAINAFAYQTPQIAPVKAIGIAQADKLNVAAANALLKTLEEPPANTYILLTTDYWGRILPTIRSRCLRINIPCDQELAHAWLSEQAVDVDAQEFARLGYGPLVVQETPMRVTQWLARIPTHNLNEIVDEAMNHDSVDVLDQWYRYLVEDISQKVSAASDSSSAKASVQVLPYLDFARDLLQTRRQLASTNSANARLLLEALILSWRELSIS